MRCSAQWPFTPCAMCVTRLHMRRELRPCKSMGAASVYNLGAASLHKSMGAASVYNLGAASLYKTMAARPFTHESMSAVSLHRLWVLHLCTSHSVLFPAQNTKRCTPAQVNGYCTPANVNKYCLPEQVIGCCNPVWVIGCCTPVWVIRCCTPVWVIGCVLHPS